MVFIAAKQAKSTCVSQFVVDTQFLEPTQDFTSTKEAETQSKTTLRDALSRPLILSASKQALTVSVSRTSIKCTL